MIKTGYEKPFIKLTFSHVSRQMQWVAFQIHTFLYLRAEYGIAYHVYAHTPFLLKCQPHHYLFELHVHIF